MGTSSVSKGFSKLLSGSGAAYSEYKSQGHCSLSDNIVILTQK